LSEAYPIDYRYIDEADAARNKEAIVTTWHRIAITALHTRQSNLVLFSEKVNQND